MFFDVLLFIVFPCLRFSEDFQIPLARLSDTFIQVGT